MKTGFFISSTLRVGGSISITLTCIQIVVLVTFSGKNRAAGQIDFAVILGPSEIVAGHIDLLDVVDAKIYCTTYKTST